MQLLFRLPNEKAGIQGGIYQRELLGTNPALVIPSSIFFLFPNLY